VLAVCLSSGIFTVKAERQVRWLVS